MLKKLVEIWGVSSQETMVSDFIAEECKPYADEIIRDALGNLIVLKRGNGENKKKIMTAAHMDEIGLMVTEITDKGFLKVKNIGGINANFAYMNRVIFRNGVEGVVGVEGSAEELKNSDIKKLYIDIGASSKEEAEKYVQVGDLIAFQGEYKELLGGNVMSKIFDDRVGCCIQMEALKKMKTPYHDVYFVFTVQEEVGTRGGTTSAERVKPDLGIAVDISASFDTPGNEGGVAHLGGGASIKLFDNSVMCDEFLTSEMIRLAEENSIPWQRDILPFGGTDAGAINKSNQGVKAVGISIPTRYGHAPHSVINLGDVKACADLLRVYCESPLKIVTEERIK